MSAPSVARSGALAMLACPSDREIIALANAVFADQPSQSESRRDNDLFYIRAIKALIDSQAQARADVAELLAADDECKAIFAELPFVPGQMPDPVLYLKRRNAAHKRRDEAFARCKGNGGAK